MPPLTSSLLIKTVIVFAAILLVAAANLRRHHPFERIGPANVVTAMRALLVALIAGTIGEPLAHAVAMTAVVAGAIATLLDGVDGWLARRTRLVSDFGARFDMETDALLIDALAIVTWLHGKAGVWVLLSGLLRYLFVGAGAVWPWMRAPLTPTRRARVICVVQVVALIAAVHPAVAPPASGAIAALGLVALLYSFAVDTLRLYRQR